ncbi:MAG: 4Fe-4S single cluster domain-containing protein [Eubacteriales bacterium]|nr:4Fe-4S single cluster domain-containing protein [Eubacteriales bacterium]
MNVARLLYPVKVLGPGNRVGIWLCGCHRRCKGCSNPELWAEKKEYEITIPQLLELIKKINTEHDIDGFTISGGEPMNQAFELSILVDELKLISKDILVYSGYRLEELVNRDSQTQHILDTIAVLIDGVYIEENNDGSLLRGSSNQRIHMLNCELESLYKDYLSKTKNQIQNFTTVDGIVSVGIHRKGFTPLKGEWLWQTILQNGTKK